MGKSHLPKAKSLFPTEGALSLSLSTQEEMWSRQAVLNRSHELVCYSMVKGVLSIPSLTSNSSEGNP